MILDVALRILFTVYIRKHWSNMGLVHDHNQEKFYRKLQYLLSSIPTSIIFVITIPQQHLRDLWIAFMRVLKVLRLFQLDQYFDVRDIRTKNNSILRIVQSILYILLITHFLSCLWLFTGRIDPHQEINWIKLVQYHKYDTPYIQKYVDSVFFTVSSMTGLGFAYIYPRTNLEYAMQSFLMVVGVSVYANFFGHFIVSIYNRNKKQIENMNKLQESKRLAMLRNFPNEIRSQIRYFYNDLRIRYDSLCDKFNILEELPNTLNSELSLFINSEIIQKVNFFQFADPSFILIMSKCLRPELCLADNYIILKGEVAEKMYFIKSGIVSIVSTDNKTVIAYMSEGTYFGEIGVLLTQKRTCYVKSKTVCVFFTISKDELNQALGQYPIQHKFLISVAKQRLQTTHPQDLNGMDKEFDLLAKDQMNLDGYDKVSHMGSLFGITSTEKERSQEKRKTIQRMNSLRPESQPKVKWYLTEEFKFIQHFTIIPFSKQVISNSSFRLFKLWTICFLLGYTYNLFYVPISLGLDFEISDNYMIIDIVAMLIIILDSAFRPFLAVEMQVKNHKKFSDYEIEPKRSKSIGYYVNNYLLLDILSSIPIDYLLLLIDGTSRIRQFIRLIRLLKLYRVSEIIGLLRKHTNIDEPVFRIVILFIIYLVAAHWFNCLLIYIAKSEIGNGSRFDGKTLLEFMTQQPYSVQPPPDKMTKWELYINLLILCLCYMGSIMYGDIIPFTIAEETLGIVQMIIGRIFISFLFAEISSYVSSQYQTYNSHISIKNMIAKWMQLNNIERPLRNRVYKYFELKWKHQRGVEEEVIIQDLPLHLRVNVKNHIFDNLMHKSKVFPKDDPGFTATITAKLQRRIIPKNEFIIRQGELANEMFFIMKGEVIVVTSDGVVVATLKKHMHFGELALIENKPQLRSTSIKASTDVVLAVLTKQDFDSICFHYPEFSQQLQEIGRQRAKDSLMKGIKVSSMRAAQSTQNSALSRFLTQRKTIPVFNQQHLSMIEEETKRANSKIESKNKNQLQVKYDTDSDIHESQISEERKDPLNDTNNINDAQIASLNAKDSLGSNLKLLSLLSPNKKRQIVNFETPGDRSPQPDSLNTSARKETLQVQQTDRVELLTTEVLNTEGPLNRKNDQPLAVNEGVAKLQDAYEILSSTGNIEQYMKKIRESDSSTRSKLVCFFISQTVRQSILFLLVLYNMIFIPLQLGFQIKFEGIYLIMEILTLAAYTVDIVLICRSMKQLQQSNRIKTESSTVNSNATQRKQQDKDELERKRRSQKLNLATSVIALIPFSLILQDTNSALFIVNLLRVLRLIKIWPFYRVIQFLKVYNVNLVRWFEVLITYYLVSHIIAGVMLSVALTKPDIRQTWLNRVPSPLPDGVRKENNLNDISTHSLYIHALYFVTNTISHVAIGDLTTVNTEERLLNCFIIWNTTFFYAFCFANISSIVSDFLGSNFLSFHEKFTTVKSLISKHKTPQSVVEKVNNYYDYLWMHSQGFDEPKEIFNELPTQIKYDVMKSRFQEAISNSLIFKNEKGEIDDPMVNSIFEMMKIRVYMSNEYIIKCGSHGQSMYIFLDGESLMFGINNDLIAILNSGTHFNNVLEEDIVENFNGKRICHIIAKTIVVVGVIDFDTLLKLFEVYPLFKQLIIKLNHAIFRQCRSLLKKYTLSIGTEESYIREMKIVENHLTFSDESIYEGLIYKLSDPRNRFLFDTESDMYRQYDFLKNQIKIFQSETGIRQLNDNKDAIDESGIISKGTGLIGSPQFKFSLEQYQGNSRNRCKRCCRSIHFTSVSRHRKLLDMLHLLNMIYIAIGIPLQISFIEEMQVSIYLEILSIAIQLIVIFVNLRTPIMVKGGFTLGFWSILKSYYNNGLIYDLFGILPLNLVFGLYDANYPNIILISCLRLLRILAIQKLLQTFEKFEIHLKTLNLFMYILKTILILFLLWHWTACFWFFINKRIELDIYLDNWYNTFKLYERELIEKYLLTFYYVIKVVTGVGQSDMITYNDLERVCFMIMINIGDTLFAFAFGLIASIQLHISQNSEFQIFLNKMKQIDEFLNSIKFEKDQSKRVEEYYAYNFYIKKKTKIVETKDLKTYLPYALLKDVIYYSQRDILAPMFKAFKSDNLIREVAAVLTNVIFMPGDYIIYKDQIGEEMYFIVEGQVNVIAADKQTVLKTLTKGNYFGEIAIFMHTKRISYVQAKEFCVVSMLKKSDLDQIVLSFPEVSKQFKVQAEKRIQETKEMERKKQAELEMNQDQDEEDDIEMSFINAIYQRMEGSQNYGQENLEQPLLETIKKKSENINQEELDRVRNAPQRNLKQIPEIKVERTSFNESGLSLNKEDRKQSDEDDFEKMMDQLLEDQKVISERDEVKPDSKKISLNSNQKSSLSSQKVHDIMMPSLSRIQEEIKREYEESEDESQEDQEQGKEIEKEQFVIDENQFNLLMKRGSFMPSPQMRKNQSAGVVQNFGSQLPSYPQDRRKTDTVNTGQKKSIKVKNESIPFEVFKARISNPQCTSDKAESTSIRRPAKKKYQRRLSKISLGKNLMLSQTAGLKLQWTVGK